MTPRIVYATLPTDRHSGGVYVMSKHVEMLRAAGCDLGQGYALSRPGPLDHLPVKIPVLLER